MANWWEHYPWRMVQTNLREIDMDGMDAESYAQQLADFGATVVNLNAAGILAGYETALDFQDTNAYLTGDSLKDMVDALHRRGIRVIARCDFTKVTERIFEKYPQWAYRDADGQPLVQSGMVQVCFNSEYQRTKKPEILKEVLTQIPFDGVFFNMSSPFVVDYDGNIHPPCHCAECRAAYEKAFGPEAEIPSKYDLAQPGMGRYLAFATRLSGGEKKRLAMELHAIRPDLCVLETDIPRSEINSDLGRPQKMLAASMLARLGAKTREKPVVDNASADFPGFAFRQISISPAQAALRQWQNLASSGCLSFFIMGTLSTHRVTSSYEPTREVFAVHREHEDIYTHMVSAAETVLVHEYDWQRLSDEEYGWCECLTAAHIPFDEIRAAELTEDGQLAGKRVVILPDVHSLRPETAQLLDRFAEAGGTVIASGAAAAEGPQSTRPACACLGLERVPEAVRGEKGVMFTVEENEQLYFPRLAQTPYLAAGDPWMRLSLKEGARTYLGQIGPHPIGPPERTWFDPKARTGQGGLSVFPYGAGQGICIPWLPGTLYTQLGLESTCDFLADVLETFAGCEDPLPHTTGMLELHMGRIEGSQTSDGLLIQMVNLTGYSGIRTFSSVPLHDICLHVPRRQMRAAGLDEAHCAAGRILGGGLQVFTEEEGVRIVLDKIGAYEGILLQKGEKQ